MNVNRFIARATSILVSTKMFGPWVSMSLEEFEADHESPKIPGTPYAWEDLDGFYAHANKHIFITVDLEGNFAMIDMRKSGDWESPDSVFRNYAQFAKLCEKNKVQLISASDFKKMEKSWG